MTESTHVYTAVLIGSPDKALAPKGGRMTLDAGRAPHVTGNITISAPAAATVTGLDPRNSPRVRVVVDGTFPSFSQHREFNLGVRDRGIPQRDGTLTLALASDEAILAEKASLADDTAPLGYQSSLRGLVNYVLNKFIPGAALNTSLSAPDVAVPALADSQNLIRNPRCAVNTTDWAATWTSGGFTTNRMTSGGPTDSPTGFTVQATGGATTGGYVYLDQNAVSLTPGKLYELSAYVRAAGAQKMSIQGWQFDGSGTIVAFSPSVQGTPAGGWIRLSTQFTATQNATKLRPVVTLDGTMTFGAYADVAGLRLSESTGDHDRDILYFDGGFADTTQYDYGWSKDPHASVSTRKALVDAATPDALTLKAGQTALDFLAPLVQRAGLRLVCDEARVWTLRGAGYSAAGLLSIRHGVNLIDGTDVISRDSGLWFDGAVTIYTWTDSNGVQQRRVDAWSLTGSPTRVVTFEKNTPYPGPGFSEYAVRRAQGRGREVTATTVADWNAAAEQPAVIYLDGAPVQVGAAQLIEFDLNSDEMTTTTRTLEIGVGSIDLLGGTINGLIGTINGL